MLFLQAPSGLAAGKLLRLSGECEPTFLGLGELLLELLMARRRGGELGAAAGVELGIRQFHVLRRLLALKRGDPLRQEIELALLLEAEPDRRRIARRAGGLGRSLRRRLPRRDRSALTQVI